jgi:hypothetical protein
MENKVMAILFYQALFGGACAILTLIGAEIGGALSNDRGLDVGPDSIALAVGIGTAIGFYCGTLVGMARVKGEIKTDKPSRQENPKAPSERSESAPS